MAAAAAAAAATTAASAAIGCSRDEETIAVSVKSALPICFLFGVGRVARANFAVQTNPTPEHTTATCAHLSQHIDRRTCASLYWIRLAHRSPAMCGVGLGASGTTYTDRIVLHRRGQCTIGAVSRTARVWQIVLVGSQPYNGGRPQRLLLPAR